MPQAAPSPCTSPGCGALVRDGSGRCAQHPRDGSFADGKRGTRHERGYDYEWVKATQRVRRRDKGLCQSCKRAGRVRLGVAVDHIVGKAAGGTNDDENLETICKACHDLKTGSEATRARTGGG